MTQLKLNLGLICDNCGVQFESKTKTKFCSRKCKSLYHGKSSQNYTEQQRRGWSRKKYLILRNGGECGKCGYSKNLAALCFHHRDGETKSMPLTIRELSNNSWEVLLVEVSKCDLLCHNCHMELHYPYANMEYVPS